MWIRRKEKKQVNKYHAEEEEEDGSNILVPNVAPEQDWQPTTNFVTTPLFSDFYSPAFPTFPFLIFLNFLRFKNFL